MTAKPKKKEGISMGETIEMINKHSKGDAIMVSDVGQHQMFTCRYAKFNSSKSYFWRSRNNGICTCCYRAKMECQTEKWWQLLVMVDSNDNSRVRDHFFKQKCQ
jgi:hypothetical protein